MRLQFAHVGLEPVLLIAARRRHFRLQQLQDRSFRRFVKRAEQRVEGWREVGRRKLRSQSARHSYRSRGAA
jgi:hypothetical protein